MEDLSVYRPDNLLHTQERITRYRPGGYHPVHLGDAFKDGRYKICHKLGWGGYSTVWLAEDTACVHTNPSDTKNYADVSRDNKWVSVKILTADSTKRSQELTCLLSLGESCQEHLSAKYIVQLLDHFTHQGPNGSHCCLVFELLGPCVDAVVQDYRDGGEHLDAEVILRLSEQLLEAVSFLHQPGFAHGGNMIQYSCGSILPVSSDTQEDLSGGNVAFGGTCLSNLSQHDIFKVLGPPELCELIRIDNRPLDSGMPSQMFKATGWDNWIEEDEEDIRILDFGEAFSQGNEPERLAQPGHLKAPETIFMDNFDYRIDLWRAGLMIYSFIFGEMPFLYLGDIPVLVSQMIDFVEELPPEWQKSWEAMASESTKEILKDGQSERSKSKLEGKFDEKVHEESLKILFPVIRGLVRFRPSDRMSASQALDLLRQGANREAPLFEDTKNGI